MRRVLHFQYTGSRDTQEDSYYADPHGRLYAVCDGVGGVANGAQASRIVIDELVAHCGAYPDIQDAEALRILVAEAIEGFKLRALQQELSQEMATTLALVLISGDTAYVAHLGDSRVYWMRPRDGRWWVTKDHSFVQELYDAGLLATEAEMRAHPMKNRITRAIDVAQADHLEDIPVNRIASLESGDLFLLGTDGAFECFTNAELVTHFTNTHKELEQRWEVFAESCRMHAVDNSTGLLIVV